MLTLALKIIYAFGSAQLKYRVWIKASLQLFFAAEPGGINWLSQSKLNQPFQIDSDAVLHMNLILWNWFGSAEVRHLNWAYADCFKLLQNQTMYIHSWFWLYVHLTSLTQPNKRSSRFMWWDGWNVTLHFKTLKTCMNLLSHESKLLFETKAERNGMQSPGWRHRYSYIKSRACFYCCLLHSQASLSIHTWT